MRPELIMGDILDQHVDVIVNSWNRNIIPWWLLIPQGASGAIKKKAGIVPFQELSRYGPIPLGEARLTSAGNLPYKGIIHVAGINMLWFATEFSVRQSVCHAMEMVKAHHFHSVAFPLIGSGSCNRNKDWSMQIMLETFASIPFPGRVVVVQHYIPTGERVPLQINPSTEM